MTSGSKSWADVEDEFPPSPPSKPQRAPSPPPPPPSSSASSSAPFVVTKIEANPDAPASATGPKAVPYLKQNRFQQQQQQQAAAAPPPRPSALAAAAQLNRAPDRGGLWEPAKGGHGGFPGFESARRGGGGAKSSGPIPRAAITKPGGRFELQLVNVPSEVQPDDVLVAQVTEAFAGLKVTKVKRLQKNQLVFVELATKLELDQALACTTLPEGWEAKPVRGVEAAKPAAAQVKPKPVAVQAANKQLPKAPKATATAAAPKKDKKPAAAATAQQAVSNAFGALADSSSEEEDE